MQGKTLLVIALVPLALAVPVILVKLVVKDHDPTLPTELLRPYEVVTAEYYGVRLDEKATPRHVVYVLLRSIKETFDKAEAPTREEQSEGVRRCREIQFAVAGPRSILASYVKSGVPPRDEVYQQKLILRTVLAWSRMLGFYVNELDLSSPDACKKWMKESISQSDSEKPATAMVRFLAKKDDFETSTIVQLARESDRWRIVRIFVAPPVVMKVGEPKAVTQPVGSQPASPKVPARLGTKPVAPTKPVRKAPVVVKPKPKAAVPAKPKAKPVAPAKPTKKAKTPTSRAAPTPAATQKQK